ncbi:MAG: restriction endonuclease subunit S [Desulfovibrionales bacterium]|nr:MAG: restriction endonuclease subunit S [Desulfovibrionales bacterium]
MSTSTLSAVIEEWGGLIQTGPFGSQLHQYDYTDEGIPVVMPKDIRNGRVDVSEIARIPESKATQLARHFLKTGSVVFPRRGEISKCAHIDEEQTGFLCGTGCIKIETPEDKLRSKFLFYYLGLRQSVEWLERNAVGTTMLNLNTKILGGLKIPLLPPKKQDEIVHTLSTYDNLIENNRRRIQLLEQAARMLYKEWFVHLRFPGHEHLKIVDGVPEGWERKPLGEIAPFKYGKALKNDDRVPGSFPVYGSSGIVGTHIKAFVSAPTIIVGRKGNVGSVYWSPDDCHPIDTVYYIDSEQCSLYLFYALQQMTFISTDVAVPGLNRDFAHSRSMLVADQKILRLFEDTVSPLHQQMELLKRQNTALAKARDILLPKLMNGEVAV